MHCCDLVELGALIAVNGSEFVRNPKSFPSGSLEHYWTASHCRFDRWFRFLKDAGTAVETQRHTEFLWPAICPGIEEILASELLTRLFIAAGTAHDVYHARHEAGPVMESVLSGQLEARRRVLELMSIEPNPVTTRLHRLQQRIERWTDLFLAHLAPLVYVQRWAIKEERVTEFAIDFAEARPNGAARAASGVLLAALHASLKDELLPEAANPDLNESLAIAVLRCLPPHFVTRSEAGSPQSLTGAEGSVSTAQALVEQFKLSEGSPSLKSVQRPGSRNRPGLPDWFGLN